MEMVSCVKCDRDMPSLRLEKYGFRHCVKCSEVEKVGAVPITNHKTGNTIQIVPMEIAINFNRLAARHGYGVSSGMMRS